MFFGFMNKYMKTMNLRALSFKDTDTERCSKILL